MIIRRAQLEDIEQVALNMRIRDVEEIRASSGKAPLDALLDAVAASPLVWTVDSEGPVAMFGVAHFFDDVGSPWMLATDGLAKLRRALLVETPKYVLQMHEIFPILINYVDARHTDSIRWLKWHGFDLSAPETHGVEGRPFHRFSKVHICVSRSQ